jgi:hypothetical protein
VAAVVKATVTFDPCGSQFVPVIDTTVPTPPEVGLTLSVGALSSVHEALAVTSFEKLVLVELPGNGVLFGSKTDTLVLPEATPLGTVKLPEIAGGVRVPVPVVESYA